MHIQAACPLSPRLQQARVEKERLHQISPHFLTQTLSWSSHLFHSLCVLWAFLKTEKHKAEWTGKSMVDNTHSPMRWCSL